MASLWNSISAVLIILLLITAGYAFGRAGWMKKEHKGFVVKLTINLAVPCLCIENVFDNLSVELLRDAGLLLLAPALASAVMMLIGYGLAKLMKISRRRFGGFVAMCGLSNSIFVGLPVCTELFGEIGIPYMMCFYIVNTGFFWAIAAPMIYASGEEDKPSLATHLKHLASPPLISLVVAVTLLLLGVKLPHIVDSFLGYMGDTVTPLALIYIGFLIYEKGLKGLKPDAGIWAVSAMRFVVGPLIMLLLCAVFKIEGVPRGVFMIEAAMPVMTQSVVVSGIAGADENYNALGMSFTSILCLVAVPILMLLFT